MTLENFWGFGQHLLESNFSCHFSEFAAVEIARKTPPGGASERVWAHHGIDAKK